MMAGTAVIVLVMGVSGSGKSTFSRALASQIGAEFVDADDFHSEQAKGQMAKGIALTDQQRRPWISHLCSIARERYRRNQSLVMACSLLRKEHRHMFYQSNLPLKLLYLQGDSVIIRQRMESRTGHFFPASLLDDQFAALQPPDESEGHLALDICESMDVNVRQAILYLEKN